MGELAGLPVVFGLYATFLPLVGYAVFGSATLEPVLPNRPLRRRRVPEPTALSVLEP